MRGRMTTIEASGLVSIKELDRPVKLTELQSAVGGLIELVPFVNTYRGERCVMFCNERGKLLNLPINDQAQRMWEECLGHTNTADVLVGDVVMLTGDAQFMASI